MGFKRTALGLIASAAFVVSSFGAVAANDVDVNVDLKPNECSVTATTSEIALGPFEYNGKNGYELTGKKGQNIGLSVTVPEPGASCETSFTLMDGVLSNGEDTISGSHMGIKPGRSGEGKHYGGSGANLLVGGNWNLLSDTSHAYTTMTTVPNDVSAGTYTGTIQITLVDQTP